MGLVDSMFETYIQDRGIEVALVKSRRDVEKLLESMLEHYGCNWIWDPNYVDPMSEVECDLFQVSRDQVIRLLHSLAFSQCEHENDAVGLRALRRISIVTFRSKSSKSKYALYLLLDLVIELSASERSKARMDYLCCVNPSGVKGGYLFRLDIWFIRSEYLSRICQYLFQDFYVIQQSYHGYSYHTGIQITGIHP